MSVARIKEPNSLSMFRLRGWKDKMIRLTVASDAIFIGALSISSVSD